MQIRASSDTGIRRYMIRMVIPLSCNAVRIFRLTIKGKNYQHLQVDWLYRTDIYITYNDCGYRRQNGYVKLHNIYPLFTGEI